MEESGAPSWIEDYTPLHMTRARPVSGWNVAASWKLVR